MNIESKTAHTLLKSTTTIDEVNHALQGSN
jgi:hypothetical protein